MLTAIWWGFWVVIVIVGFVTAIVSTVKGESSGSGYDDGSMDYCQNSPRAC